MKNKYYLSYLYQDDIIYNHKINKICVNSKQVEMNDIFIAISGLTVDGNDFISEAIRNGAKTIITEEKCYYDDVNIVIVENARKELARILKKLYHKIMKKMTIIGVTGTNGKTTTTTLVHRYLQKLDIDALLIGSNGIFYRNIYYEGINTTPDIVIIYQAIYQAYLSGCRYVIMEVSSHAIKQMRVLGIDFYVVLLTNLTLDHLDYHGDFTDYKYTKGLLINSVSEDKYVILNRDCEYYRFFAGLAKARVVSYGSNNSDFLIKDVKLTDNETTFTVSFKNKSLFINTSLMGMFNVYNIVSFIAIITAIKRFNKQAILAFLKEKIIIPGRMEEVNYKNRKIIVDFAHTPDGIFNVLSFLKTLKRRIILVVGCGGSRDKTKRRVVGEISVANSDYVIFTSDNPRDEDEEDIIKDIIRDIEKTNYQVITDRKLAIATAINISRENDIIAILGRGNEQYQIVKGEKIPFSDMEVVLENIKEG